MSGVEILCVCTGNVCRSPAAERLLAEALSPLGVHVTRAGTAAPVGAPISEEMARLLLAAGVDAADHRARRLSGDDIRRADLVLGMSGEHRSHVVEFEPAALRRSFTLLELAAIARLVPAAELEPGPADAAPSDRLRALIRLAPRYRGQAAAGDIDDPIGCDEATYARVFAQIQGAVDLIATVVAR